MTANRELLELAAKAAGMELDREGTAEADGKFAVLPDYRLWNPLTDDGDALRLAAALKMDIVYRDDGVGAGDIDEGAGEGAMWGARHEAEPAAAYRRAIVRAAAAIGEQTCRT